MECPVDTSNSVSRLPLIPEYEDISSSSNDLNPQFASSNSVSQPVHPENEESLGTADPLHSFSNLLFPENEEISGTEDLSTSQFLLNPFYSEYRLMDKEDEDPFGLLFSKNPYDEIQEVTGTSGNDPSDLDVQIIPIDSGGLQASSDNVELEATVEISAANDEKEEVSAAKAEEEGSIEEKFHKMYGMSVNNPFPNNQHILESLAIYYEECVNNKTLSKDEFLPRFVEKHNLNYLVISQYTESTQYGVSLYIAGKVSKLVLIGHMSIMESAMLEGINKQQLPSFILESLLELSDSFEVQLLYDSHMFVKITQSRSIENPRCLSTKFLLLRPTQNTEKIVVGRSLLLYDKILARKNMNLSSQKAINERNIFLSAYFTATAEPLDLGTNKPDITDDDCDNDFNSAGIDIPLPAGYGDEHKLYRKINQPNFMPPNIIRKLYTWRSRAKLSSVCKTQKRHHSKKLETVRSKERHEKDLGSSKENKNQTTIKDPEKAESDAKKGKKHKSKERHEKDLGNSKESKNQTSMEDHEKTDSDTKKSKKHKSKERHEKDLENSKEDKNQISKERHEKDLGNSKEDKNQTSIEDYEKAESDTKKSKRHKSKERHEKDDLGNSKEDKNQTSIEDYEKAESDTEKSKRHKSKEKHGKDDLGNSKEDKNQTSIEDYEKVESDTEKSKRHKSKKSHKKTDRESSEERKKHKGERSYKKAHRFDIWEIVKPEKQTSTISDEKATDLEISEEVAKQKSTISDEKATDLEISEDVAKQRITIRLEKVSDRKISEEVIKQKSTISDEKATDLEISEEVAKQKITIRLEKVSDRKISGEVIKQKSAISDEKATDLEISEERKKHKGERSYKKAHRFDIWEIVKPEKQTSTISDEKATDLEISEEVAKQKSKKSHKKTDLENIKDGIKHKSKNSHKKIDLENIKDGIKHKSKKSHKKTDLENIKDGIKHKSKRRHKKADVENAKKDKMQKPPSDRIISVLPDLSGVDVSVYQSPDTKTNLPKLKMDSKVCTDMAIEEMKNLVPFKFGLTGFCNMQSYIPSVAEDSFTNSELTIKKDRHSRSIGIDLRIKTSATTYSLTDSAFTVTDEHITTSMQLANYLDHMPPVRRAPVVTVAPVEKEHFTKFIERAQAMVTQNMNEDSSLENDRTMLIENGDEDDDLNIDQTMMIEIENGDEDNDLKYDGEIEVYSTSDLGRDGEIEVYSTSDLGRDGEIEAYSTTNLGRDGETEACSTSNVKEDGEIEACSTSDFGKDGETEACSTSNVTEDGEIEACSTPKFGNEFDIEVFPTSEDDETEEPWEFPFKNQSESLFNKILSGKMFIP